MSFTFFLFNCLWRLCTLCFDIKCVEAHAAGHKEAVFHVAAKAEIRARFGKVNFAYEVTFWSKNLYTVVFGFAPARAGPEVAVFVAANTICETGFHVDKDAAVG